MIFFFFSNIFILFDLSLSSSPGEGTHWPQLLWQLSSWRRNPSRWNVRLGHRLLTDPSMHPCAQTLWVKQNSSAVLSSPKCQPFPKGTLDHEADRTRVLYVLQQWTPWQKAAVSAVGGTAEEERHKKGIVSETMFRFTHSLRL